MLSSAAALPAERRVLARRGWEGERAGIFEHPASEVEAYPVDDGMAGKRFASLFRRRHQRCVGTCRADPESELG